MIRRGEGGWVDVGMGGPLDSPLKIGVEKSFSWTLVRASAWITAGECYKEYTSAGRGLYTASLFPA